VALAVSTAAVALARSTADVAFGLKLASLTMEFPTAPDLAPRCRCERQTAGYERRCCSRRPGAHARVLRLKGREGRRDGLPSRFGLCVLNK
jgi:hypothetical protein